MLTYKSSRVLFRSIATIAVALTVCFSVHAQDQDAKNVQAGKFGVSPLLGYGGFGSDGAKGVTGGGAKLHINVANSFRLSASSAGYIGVTGVDDKKAAYLRDISLNGQYLFYIKDVQLAGDKSTPMYLYPLAGVSFYKATVKNLQSNAGGDPVTLRGINIGGGVEQVVNNSISIFMEAKYSFGKDLSRLAFAVGVSFYF